MVKQLASKFLFLLAITSPAWAQIPYVAQKSTSLSSAAEVITIQSPASNPRFVKFLAAYVDCSAACIVTLEKDGTAATTTALTLAKLNSNDPAPVTNAYYSSNAGVGTVLGVYSIAAGGNIIINLDKVVLPQQTNKQNLTIRTSSITGVVNIIVMFTEQNIGL